MDGTFSKGSGPQKERILNWSAIFDELHDFERNTRGVSNGIGALVSSEALVEGSRLDISTFAPVGKPLRDLQEGLNGAGGPSVVKDWDDINEWVKTIRPPLGKRFADAASVTRGRALFTGSGPTQGNCAACHGGAGWTVSRKFYTPSIPTNEALLTEAFDGAAMPFGANPHTTQIQLEPNPGGAGIAPPHVSCVLRDVGTFGVPGDTTATDLLEVKGLANSPRAQGEFAGYNVPSLYGLQVGAPFLHHGQAGTLDALLDPTNTAYQPHLTSGNAIFSPSATDQADLKAFLLSIDAKATEAPLPAGADVCP
jgi:mono/diheme cytochrome c family protein